MGEVRISKRGTERDRKRGRDRQTDRQTDGQRGRKGTEIETGRQGSMVRQNERGFPGIDFFSSVIISLSSYPPSTH